MFGIIDVVPSQTSAIAEVLLFFSVFSPGEGTLESSQSKQIQRCFLMAKKLKISVSQTQTIREAFDDFLLQKKALGLADKTIETYSHHFGIISKYLDSSAPIAGLFKRPLDEMIERMRSAGMKDTSINSYTRTFKSFLSWCNREGLTQANITLYSIIFFPSGCRLHTRTRQRACRLHRRACATRTRACRGR